MQKVMHKMIKCILPKGRAKPVLRALKEEKGIVTANIDSARGVGRLTPLSHRGVGEQTEKDILSVIVPAPEADALFAWIYEHADINQPHGGLIFMHVLGRTSVLELPDLPEEHD